MRPARDPGSSATSSARKPSASSKRASSSEGWGDEASFRRIAESHRREIQLHCYRLVGSLHDAEDLTQDTFLRAWQGITRFEGRTTVRNWLYRIATNVCLTAISKRSIPRRVLPESVAGPTRRMPRGSPADDVPWIEPYPDSELEGSADSSADPRSRYEMREAVRLAFIAVTQRLPARIGVNISVLRAKGPNGVHGIKVKKRVFRRSWVDSDENRSGKSRRSGRTNFGVERLR